MALTVEEIQILVEANINDAIKGLKKTEKESDSLKNSLGKTAKFIAGAAVTGAIIGAFVKISKESAKAASDAEEIAGKFEVVFGNISADANAAAKTIATEFDLAASTVNKLLGDTGDILTGLGFDQKTALELSSQVGTLALDLASFTNFAGGAEGASAALTKALLGEAESAKALGIVIRQDTEEYKDLIDSIMKTNGVGLVQAKALAALQIATEQSKNAIGDYQRTQESAANVERRLNEQLKESKELYGGILNEGLTPIRAALADEIGLINQSIKAYFLKNKVLAGEATRIEEIISKENEQAEAEKELQQAKDNLAASQASIVSNSNSEIIALQNAAKATQDLIPGQQELIIERQFAVAALGNQVSALEELQRQEQADLDLKLSLAAATSEETEANDELSTSFVNLAFQANAYRNSLMDADFAHRKFTDNVLEGNEEQKISWQDLETQGIETFVSGFSAIGEALAGGSLGFKDFGKVALQAVSSVLQALGAELAALATVQLLLGDIPGAAIGYAESAAAFTASGVVAGLASQAFAEGGSFQTNGPKTILVGDNPGGVENVTVEPVSSAGANEGGGPGGETMILMIDGQQFTGHIQRQIDNRAVRSSRGGAI